MPFEKDEGRFPKGQDARRLEALDDVFWEYFYRLESEANRLISEQKEFNEKNADSNRTKQRIAVTLFQNTFSRFVKQYLAIHSSDIEHNSNRAKLALLLRNFGQELSIFRRQSEHKKKSSIGSKNFSRSAGTENDMDEDAIRSWQHPSGTSYRIRSLAEKNVFSDATALDAEGKHLCPDDLDVRRKTQIRRFCDSLEDIKTVMNNLSECNDLRDEFAHRLELITNDFNNLRDPPDDLTIVDVVALFHFHQVELDTLYFEVTESELPENKSLDNAVARIIAANEKTYGSWSEHMLKDIFQLHQSSLISIYVTIAQQGILYGDETEREEDSSDHVESPLTSQLINLQAEITSFVDNYCKLYLENSLSSDERVVGLNVLIARQRKVIDRYKGV